MAKTIYETGRYLIIAQRINMPSGWPTQKPQKFVARLLVDEYGGWLKFDCAFRGGALLLCVKQKGHQWICSSDRWRVTKVKMITRQQYLKEVVII